MCKGISTFVRNQFQHDKIILICNCLIVEIKYTFYDKQILFIMTFIFLTNETLYCFFTGHCPIYNTGAKKMDSIKCSDPHCPRELYTSDKVYKCKYVF